MNTILALGVVSFIVCLVVTPLVRDAAGRLGIVDRPDGGRRRHHQPIPRVGGVAIVIAYVASFLIVLALPMKVSPEIATAIPIILKLTCAAGLVFVTGLLDDIVGFRPWQKLLGQIWGALLAYMAGVQIEVFPDNEWSFLWNVPISVLWIVACTNAFNLIDGLDGLSAGVGFFATLTMLLAAFTNRSLDLAIVTIPLAGCLLGFLRYNFNPASVFLGDCGSLLIGFLLGCYGVIWSQKSATLLGMTAPLLAISIPLMDASISVVRRFLRNQPIFEGDRGHIHHMLLARGLTPRRVALVMYAVSSIAAAFSLIQNSFHNHYGGIIILLFCGAAWMGVQHLGYVEFAMARRMFLKGNLRRMIDSETRLQALELDLRNAQDADTRWTVLCHYGREFGFSRITLRLGGITMQQDLRSEDAPTWQIRITLSDSEFVSFDRCSAANPDSLAAVGRFTAVVEAGLAHKSSVSPAAALTAGLPG